jgi:DNA-binding winged helix-turn-helix (wHTH) protein/TolB-like protein/tetratricopeptide (TPR) repeat protein
VVSTSQEIFVFGRFRLDVVRREFAADGLPVALSSRAFDILRFLIENRDRIVGKDEIIAHVWRGTMVEENNLAVQLSSLRRVLSDGEGGARLIVTVPGQGYRFIGNLAQPEAAVSDAAGEFAGGSVSSPEQPAKPKTRLAAIVTAGAGLACLCGVSFYFWHARSVLAPGLSIVVLPFHNPGGNPANAYLANAITDDLTNDLGHIPQSTVIANESAASVSGKGLTAQQIGQKLQVRYILEGGVDIDDAAHPCNARLIDTGTGAALWSFECPGAGTVPSARDAIVHGIASALHFAIDQLESSRSLHDRPDNPNAIDLFFEARAILDQKDTLEGLERAQKLLEQAIALQPDFGDALTALGATLLRKIWEFTYTEAARDLQQAHDVIAEAIRLAPRNALAWASKAELLQTVGEYRQAQAAAEVALAIEPNSVEALSALASNAWQLGQLDAEAKYLATINRLDPTSVASTQRIMSVATIALLRGEAAESERLLLTLNGGEPDRISMADSTYWISLLLVAAYQLDGESQRASTLYRKFAASWPNRSAWRFGVDYFPKAVSALPGAAHILAALHDAGMPQFGDGAIALSGTASCRADDDYSPTPLALAGGTVISAHELADRLGGPTPPLVVDIGKGAYSPKSARWRDPVTAEQSNVDFITKLAADRGTAIVIMSDGPFGCDSHDAATALIGRGYTSILWFRGGEEAWAKARMPFSDFRP